MASELQIEVVPFGPDAQVADAAVGAALGHPAVRGEIEDVEHWVLSVRPIGDADAEPPTAVEATVYDYTNERALVVEVPLNGDGTPRVASTTRQPLPTEQERMAALAALTEDPELGPEVRAGRLVPYRPMPPLLTEEEPDGRVLRAVTVGLQPAEGHDGGGGHEIVAVPLARGGVMRFADGAPPGALALRPELRPARGRAADGPRRAGRARITVKQDGEVLWTLIANRPAASSGTNGSGVELRDVSYRGKRIFRRAHVPILNVRYDHDACGPYRDWQNEESMLSATAPTPRRASGCARPRRRRSSSPGTTTGTISASRSSSTVTRPCS